MKTIHNNKVETSNLGFALWEDHHTVKNKQPKVIIARIVDFLLDLKVHLSFSAELFSVNLSIV